MTEYSHEDYIRFVDKYGSIRKASEDIGIPRTTFRRKMATREAVKLSLGASNEAD